MLQTKSQTKTATLLKLTFSKVHRIMQLGVMRGMERRELGDAVKHISMDEKAFKKGHQYVTILTDPDNDRVLGVIAGRTKESAKQLLTETFTKKQKAGIKSVCTDMWEAYINTCKEELPNAKLCNDKFHLVKYLNEAVDNVRKQEVKKQYDLKQTKYLWLKDQMNMTEKQRIKFESINQINYETARAWRIKENFRDISFNQSAQEALPIFMRWYHDAMKTQLKPIMKVAEMFHRHIGEIINAMVLGRNNAKAERMNGNIQELKVIARGYRNINNFINAILFFNGKLNLYPQENL